MIILRLIYISEKPSPKDNIKEKKIKNNEIEEKKKININNNQTNLHSPNLKEINKSPMLNIANFRQFVDLFYKNREALLHTQLYNSIKLISFKEGEVIINTSLIRDPNFNRNVAKLVSKWTGRIWQIHSSDSNIGSSLSDEDIINNQNEIKIMKNHPEIKKILNTLPGLSIHSITDITDSVDETINEIMDEKHKEV
jgi:hypothetical protein